MAYNTEDQLADTLAATPLITSFVLIFLTIFIQLLFYRKLTLYLGAGVAQSV
jgi:hypothetical protein